MNGFCKRKGFRSNPFVTFLGGAALATGFPAVAFAESTIEVPSEEVIASDFCGKPKEFSEPGLYLWQDCEVSISSDYTGGINSEYRNRRTVTGVVKTTDNSSAFSGSLLSKWGVTDLTYENGSFVSQPSPGKGVNFSVPANGNVETEFSFVAKKHAGQFDLTFDNVIPSVYIGNSAKKLLSSSVQPIPFYEPKAYTQAEYEDNLGIINVKFYEDNNSDTAAIQNAINDGIEKGMMVYLPSREYQISDSLDAKMPVVFIEGTGNNEDKWEQDRRKPLVFVGSTIGDGRPSLKLANNATGFDNESTPKPMLQVWAQCRDGGGQCSHGVAGNDNFATEQPNINFSQVIRGIDIDVSNHAGAIGIHHAGSQGSSISDVKITATNAYAGMREIPGQGGGVYNVEIEGGDYGITSTKKSRYPQIAGVKLSNQEKAAILVNLESPLVLAGFHISGSPEAAIEIDPGIPHSRQAGAVSLIDGVVDFNSSESLLIKNEHSTDVEIEVKDINGEPVIINGEPVTRIVQVSIDKNLYLKDIFVKGGKTNLITLSNGVDNSGKNSILDTNYSTGWNFISEYSFTAGSSQGFVDSLELGSATREYLKDPISNHSPDTDEAVFMRHVWDDRVFPTFEHSDVVIATSAYGDSSKDLSQEELNNGSRLNLMLNDFQKVFLPVGIFKIEESVNLGGDDVLIGAGKTFATLQATTSSPIITTDSDKYAKTTLSGLLLNRENSIENTASYVHWQAGAQSVYRDNVLGMDWANNFIETGQAVLINGHGGGRWYGLTGEWSRLQRATEADWFNTSCSSDNPENSYPKSSYRGLNIQNTRQPLAFYGLNVERVQAKTGSAQVTINDSQRVSIYYLKGESVSVEVTCNGSTKKHEYVYRDGPDSLKVSNSSLFELFGFSGKAEASQSNVTVVNVDSYLMANISEILNESGNGMYSFYDPSSTPEVNVLSDKPASIVKKNNPNWDKLSVVNVVYATEPKKVWIRATSTSLPKGTASITATVISASGEEYTVNLPWNQTKNAYQASSGVLDFVPKYIWLESDDSWTVWSAEIVTKTDF